METHRRACRGIFYLQSLMNSTFLDYRRSDVPNLAKFESGSSTRWGMPLTEGSMLQTEAAPLTRVETSLINGREIRSVCQQSSSSFQTSSESPSSSAFAGFDGLSPLKTSTTTSYFDILPNGNVPVRTYKVGINMRTHSASRGMHLVHYHSHRIYVGLLRRRASVQSEPWWNKEFWCHERSGPATYFDL